MDAGIDKHVIGKVNASLCSFCVSSFKAADGFHLERKIKEVLHKIQMCFLNDRAVQ